jgi:hypothetical protein
MASCTAILRCCAASEPQVWRELKEDVDARLVEGEEVGWERVWHEERVEIEEIQPADPEPAD